MNLTGELGPTIQSGPLWLQDLYANGTANLTSTTTVMQDFANAMTAAVRGRGEGAAAQVSVHVSETCVRVEWPWLALDVALVGLTLIFLATTIWHRVKWREKEPLETVEVHGNRSG